MISWKFTKSIFMTVLKSWARSGSANWIDLLATCRLTNWIHLFGPIYSYACVRCSLYVSLVWQIHSLPSPMFFLTTCLSCELRWQPRKARLRNQCFTAIIVILPNILTSGEGSCLDFLDELLPYFMFLSQTSAFILQLEQDSWCIVQTKWIRSLASALTHTTVCFISRVW